MVKGPGGGRVRYLILMTNDDVAWDALPAAEQARVIEAHAAFEAALRSAGCWIDAWRLRPGAEARTVTRDRAGAVRVAAGPALPGPACVGGAYLIEAASLEAALEWAERGRFIAGANEVRQIWEE
jgi:hypothetical protein